jgi:hypothetical protein
MSPDEAPAMGTAVPALPPARSRVIGPSPRPTERGCQTVDVRSIVSA